MKNLLLVAYYFPPSGGPGVQRVLKHIRYLPEFGWNPIVLTVANGQYPAIDESLINQIPESTLVYKSKIYEPYDLYRLFTGKSKGSAIDVNVIKKENQKSTFKEKIAELIRATLFIPDARMGWLLTAGRKANRIAKEHRISAVYSSSPPYTCSLIARNFKQLHRVPWVAGFRDPWRGFISAPKRWFLPELIDIRMERTVFEQANAVECAWQGIIKDALGKYPRLDKSKFYHVPNGFDPNDFPKVEFQPNKRFTMTYTGSMYGRRNPAALFEAIERLVADGKITPDKIHLRFVGRFGTEIHDMFDRASFKDSIEIIGYVPHEKSIEYLILSDILLLIVDESKESEEIVPGKVYEYIGTRRPVFAIAPKRSAIAELIEETHSGLLAHQSQIDTIAENFLKLYTMWESSEGEISLAPDLNSIRKYERRESARKLAEILDRLTKT